MASKRTTYPTVSTAVDCAILQGWKLVKQDLDESNRDRAIMQKGWDFLVYYYGPRGDVRYILNNYSK